MITAEEFRRRWLEGCFHEDPFKHYETSEIRLLNLPDEDARFLEEVGLPKFAAHFYFGESPKVMEGSPYVIIGTKGEQELVAVDTTGTGHVLWIHGDAPSSPAWFNKSIPILCESMVLYSELQDEAGAVNGRLAARLNNIPDFLIDQFEKAIFAIDARAVEDSEALWNRKISFMRSHAANPEKKIFRPDIPLTTSMTEAEFCNEIDCRFYFNSLEEFENAVRVGCSISDNAAMAVGCELASYVFPVGHVPFRLRLLKLLKNERCTEVVLLAVPIIEAMIIDLPTDPKNLRRLLDYCYHNPGQYGATALLFHADFDDTLWEEIEQLRESWG
jgi:hypothetical protein